MKPSCHRMAYFLISALAATAAADVLPPDHHVVARTVAILNAEEFPDKVFIACETAPGASKPHKAWRMRSGEQAAVGYKFNRLDLHWIPASTWSWVSRDYGIAEKWSPGGGEVHGVWIQASEGRGWILEGQLAARIQAELATAPRTAPSSDAAVAERFGYYIEHLDWGGSLTLMRTITEYSDGRPPLIRDWPSTAVARGDRSAPELEAVLSPDGKSLDLRPARGGPAEIGLVDARGIRVFQTRRDLAAGKDLSLALPALAPGRYLLTLKTSAFRQTARIDF